MKITYAMSGLHEAFLIACFIIDESLIFSWGKFLYFYLYKEEKEKNKNREWVNNVA